MSLVIDKSLYSHSMNVCTCHRIWRIIPKIFKSVYFVIKWHKYWLNREAMANGICFEVAFSYLSFKIYWISFITSLIKVLERYRAKERFFHFFGKTFVKIKIEMMKGLKPIFPQDNVIEYVIIYMLNVFMNIGWIGSFLWFRMSFILNLILIN